MLFLDGCEVAQNYDLYNCRVHDLAILSLPDEDSRIDWACMPATAERVAAIDSYPYPIW